MEQVVSTQLVNSKSSTVTLYIEPWGDAHDMQPGAVFGVIATGPSDGHLEVELGDDHITVYGWQGSVVKVYHEGEELGAGLWEREPVPQMPKTRS